MSTSLWCLAAVITLIFVNLLRQSRARNRLPLPPGPPRLPFIGNLLDVPTTNMAEAFRDMNTTYGDVVYLDALGQPMIILGTHEAAADLMEKRSANYSDRTISTMSELCGLNWVLTLLHYGPWWRRHRRMLHQFFNSTAILQYQPSQRQEARRFVLRLIDSPEAFVHHIRHLFGSTVLRIAYGIEVDDGNEGYLAMAEEALAVFSAATVPGKYLVETFPVLRHVPAWMPGARFKREAAEWIKATTMLLQSPWKVARDAVRDGTAGPCMATTLLEGASRLTPEEAAEEETVASHTVAVAYGAGADTTLSTVQTFILAMAANPEVQKKAQAELDAVVGPNRLPTFDDKGSLPYICALAKECLRWRSVVPLGVPHRSLEDDEYRGYFIPKGSIVISNIWAFSHDPSVYAEPERFMPERLFRDGRLNSDVRDPATIAFGYGRRICPGRYFAESSLFIIVATVLHALSIGAPIGDDGKPVHLEGKMTEGLLAYPEPFKCTIRPRSKAFEALIHASCVDGDVLSETL